MLNDRTSFRSGPEKDENRCQCSRCSGKESGVSFVTGGGEESGRKSLGTNQVWGGGGVFEQDEEVSRSSFLRVHSVNGTNLSVLTVSCRYA